MKILVDTHVHTISSGHAYSTIDEIAKFAKSQNLEAVAITDHTEGLPGGAHPFYFGNIRVLPDYIRGVRIFKGVEVNIIDYHGNVDMEADVLESLDIVVASLHPPCIPFADKEVITKTLMKTIENPNVDIIGHPGDNRYPMDFETIVKHAKAHKVLLEVNNASLRPTSIREGVRENLVEILKLCIKYENPIVVASDAHFHEDVGGLAESIELLEEVNFPEHLIMNQNKDRLMNFIEKRRM
ncbi:MAG TPA: phosphatase [Epulopiscium sp.]|nr:phosphatase [Candidatus Epulonipiscium sp.]